MTAELEQELRHARTALSTRAQQGGGGTKPLWR